MRNDPDLTLPGFHHNRNGFRNLRDFTQRKPANTLPTWPATSPEGGSARLTAPARFSIF